jgi:flagellar motor protein MotB
MNRVRHGIRAQPAHTDDWLITYADMITLLLCFFVMFFVILSSRKNGQQEAPAAGATAHVAQVFPQATAQSTSTPVVQRDLTFDKLGELDQSHANSAPVVALVAPVSSGAEPTVSSNSANTDAAQIASTSELQNSPDIDKKQDRITVLEMSSSAFFDSGSAKLSSGGKSILRGVAVELQSDRYEGYQIVVEGHTDDAPIATQQFSSNWELSTARAAAVVHFFLDQGIQANKLRAAGYADTNPEVPNRDFNGNAIPENQAQNRRVVIKLEKIEKPD